MISLNISIIDQKLQVWDSEILLKSYSISTSKFGTGFEKGSNKTPTGNFIIDKKIGTNEPLMTIFKGRQPINIWNEKPTEEDLVLSRILWFSGTEIDNTNTKERYIYIHGTNQENLIGTPSSHECIRMKNNDIVELYKLVQEGTEIIINSE